MSEYQYYEWQTLDRPLTDAERTAVNRLSSHIEVSSTRAVVTYSWGNFKHDPRKVLERYFDAFLYLANWGSRQLAFRFPKGLLDPQQIEPYLWEDRIELEPLGEHLILDLNLDEEEGGGWIEGESWLSSLAGLRDDILQGDFRVLYLAWLAAAELALEDDVDEQVEPPVPPGLDELSAALTSFVELFELDPYLVQAAAQASEPRRPTPDIPLEAAIVRLSPIERDAFLLRLAQGEPHLSVALNRRLRELTGAPRSKATAAHRRTWGALQTTAETLRQEAKRREEAAAEARRIAELEALAQRETQAWADVTALIEQKQAKPYDEAVALLVKLRDLAVYRKQEVAFWSRMTEIAGRYRSRPSLMERFRKARLYS